MLFPSGNPKWMEIYNTHLPTYACTLMCAHTNTHTRAHTHTHTLILPRTYPALSLPHPLRI